VVARGLRRPSLHLEYIVRCAGGGGDAQSWAWHSPRSGLVPGTLPRVEEEQPTTCPSWKPTRRRDRASPGLRLGMSASGPPRLARPATPSSRTAMYGVRTTAHQPGGASCDDGSPCGTPSRWAAYTFMSNPKLRPEPMVCAGTLPNNNRPIPVGGITVWSSPYTTACPTSSILVPHWDDHAPSRDPSPCRARWPIITGTPSHITWLCNMTPDETGLVASTRFAAPAGCGQILCPARLNPSVTGLTRIFHWPRAWHRAHSRTVRSLAGVCWDCLPLLVSLSAPAAHGRTLSVYHIMEMDFLNMNRCMLAAFHHNWVHGISQYQLPRVVFQVAQAPESPHLKRPCGGTGYAARARAFPAPTIDDRKGPPDDADKDTDMSPPSKAQSDVLPRH